MVDVATLVSDLRAESADLDALVAPLTPQAWATPTPAQGWTIAHQVGHLQWTDQVSVIALTDPARFSGPLLTDLLTDLTRGANPVDEAAVAAASAAPLDLLETWRSDRETLAATLLAQADRPDRVPWFGPPMSVTSMVTARLMETWAHGQDVADALGVTRPGTLRLRHIAHLGVRTRDFGYAAHGLTPPPEPFLVELAAPGGGTWVHGPQDATNRVTGSALDFCLLITQRRHRADLDLVATGAEADRWLDIAQAFAGPPGAGRAAGQFPRPRTSGG